MLCFGTQFKGGLGSPGSVAGPGDIKVLFQPKWFHDSMILKSLEAAC